MFPRCLKTNDDQLVSKLVFRDTTICRNQLHPVPHIVFGQEGDQTSSLGYKSSSLMMRIKISHQSMINIDPQLSYLQGGIT